MLVTAGGPVTVITIDKTHGLIVAAVGNVIKYVGLAHDRQLSLYCPYVPHLFAFCFCPCTCLISCDCHVTRLFDQQLEVVQISCGHTDSIQSILHVPELNLVRRRTSLYDVHTTTVEPPINVYAV